MWCAARGVVAALAFSGLSWFTALAPAGAATPAPAPALPMGTSVLPDGLGVQLRPVRISPLAAIQVWASVPSDGFDQAQPGIARLAALAVINQTISGQTLRDVVRDDSGQLVVTVYQAATEVSVVVPSYAAPAVARGLMMRMFHPSISQAALADARQRLAAQQAALQGQPELVLRDAVFASLFQSGAYHDSSFGTPATLTDLNLATVQDFARKAFVAGHCSVVISGDIDAAATQHLVAGLAPLPEPTHAPVAAALNAKPLTTIISDAQTQTSGVALAWAGPPITDERSATAMDFLADYLLRPDYGVLATQLRATFPDATVGGEFVTLRDPGVFYATVLGRNVNTTAALSVVRDQITKTATQTMNATDFAHAIDVYRAHALHDSLGSAEIMADNYGWYYVHGAPAYAPSAADQTGTGDYYAQLASLTPQYVAQVARMYLLAAPATAILAARPPSAAEVPRSTPSRASSR